MGQTLRIALVLLIASSLGAAAQVPSPPRSMLIFEHDGRNVTGFVLYATGVEGGVALAFDLGPLRPDSSGKITAPVPALPNGVYVLEVAAYNQRGESPRVTAVPPRIEVSSAPRAAVTGAEARKPAGTAPKAAPAAPRATQPVPKAEEAAPKADEAKRRGGVFGKLWRGVIGSDD